MSLFGMPDGEPDSLREDPHMGPFDFTGEEDLFVLNDRAIALHRQVVERVQRLNAWVDEQGCEKLLEERIQQAAQAAAGYGATTSLQAMFGTIELPFEQFVTRQDPILRSQQAMKLAEGYNEALTHLHRVQATMADVSPEIAQQVHRAALELAKTIYLNMMAYDVLMERFIERVEHGVPEWDPETGTEKELEEGIPHFGGTSTPALPESTKEQDDVVAARLLNGLLF